MRSTQTKRLHGTWVGSPGISQTLGHATTLTQTKRDFLDMAVTVEMHNTGDPELRTEVAAVVEHVLSGRPGDWRVSIIGSQENDRWEMKIFGSNAFERSYTLEGTA